MATARDESAIPQFARQLRPEVKPASGRKCRACEEFASQHTWPAAKFSRLLVDRNFTAGTAVEWFSTGHPSTVDFSGGVAGLSGARSSAHPIRLTNPNQRRPAGSDILRRVRRARRDAVAAGLKRGIAVRTPNGPRRARYLALVNKQVRPPRDIESVLASITEELRLQVLCLILEATTGAPVQPANGVRPARPLF